MNKYLKNYLLIFLCIIAIVGICIYFDPQKEVTLNLGVYSGSAWDVPYNNSYQAIDEIIARFEKKYPYIHVKYTAGITKDDYSDWLSEKIINGQTPDIFIIPDEDFNVLANTKVLSNLNPIIEKHLYDTDVFYSSALAAGNVNGSQYGLPIESNPMVMCVNLDLLKKVGIKKPKRNWTVQDLYQYGKKISKKGYYPICNYSWEEAVEDEGAELFDQAGTHANFETSEVQKALSDYVQLLRLNNSKEVSSEDFDRNRVAFMPMTLAEYRTYKSYPYRVSRYFGFHWGVIPMPGSFHKKIHMHTSLMAISSSSRYKENAWKLLLAFTGNAISQENILRKSSGTSVLRSVMLKQSIEELIPALSNRTLDQIMTYEIAYPNFRNYNQAINRADYLINNSIKNDTLGSDFSTIQRSVQEML